MNLASPKQLWTADIKEPEVAICERTDHVRLELVHGYVDTFFLWHYELLAVLQVMHIPKLDVPVGRGSCDLVVLVEGVVLVLSLADRELTGRDIFEVSALNDLLGVVAIL